MLVLIKNQTKNLKIIKKINKTKESQNNKIHYKCQIFKILENKLISSNIKLHQIKKRDDSRYFYI